MELRLGLPVVEKDQYQQDAGCDEEIRALLCYLHHLVADPGCGRGEHEYLQNRQEISGRNNLRAILTKPKVQTESGRFQVLFGPLPPLVNPS